MDWIEDVVSRLSNLGDVSTRAMFGGHGLYWRGVIFAIGYRERLYFKVDGASRAAFEARGMTPFRPNERHTLKSYYEVPPETLDDHEALLAWAAEAIRAGQEHRARRRPR